MINSLFFDDSIRESDFDDSELCVFSVPASCTFDCEGYDKVITTNYPVGDVFPYLQNTAYNCSILSCSGELRHGLVNCDVDLSKANGTIELFRLISKKD